MANVKSIPSAVFSPIQFLRYKLSCFIDKKVTEGIEVWMADNEILETIAVNSTQIMTLVEDAEDLRECLEELDTKTDDYDGLIEDLQTEEQRLTEEVSELESKYERLEALDFEKDLEEINANVHQLKKLNENLNKAFIQVTRCWVQ